MFFFSDCLFPDLIMFIFISGPVHNRARSLIRSQLNLGIILLSVCIFKSFCFYFAVSFTTKRENNETATCDAVVHFITVCAGLHRHLNIGKLYSLVSVFVYSAKCPLKKRS